MTMLAHGRLGPWELPLRRRALPRARSDHVVVCNCSICDKKGFLHFIVPPERFELVTERAAVFDIPAAKARLSLADAAGGTIRR